jgi:hypothetical protein
MLNVITRTVVPPVPPAAELDGAAGDPPPHPDAIPIASAAAARHRVRTLPAQQEDCPSGLLFAEHCPGRLSSARLELTR